MVGKSALCQSLLLGDFKDSTRFAKLGTMHLLSCRFQGNRGKQDFPLGAEAVGIVVALGANPGDLKVLPEAVASYTCNLPCCSDLAFDDMMLNLQL